MESADNLPQAIECLLFASGEPLAVDRIAEVLGCSASAAEVALRALEAQLEGRGLQVVRIAGGFALATRPQFADYVARLRQPPAQRLSAAALEVLAIIAYRQPVTKPEIDAVRGVDSGAAIRSLLEKRLVAVKGRKRAPGRPLLLVTTEQFLHAFGLNDLSELPKVPAAFAERARQMSLEESTLADRTQPSGEAPAANAGASAKPVQSHEQPSGGPQATAT